MLIRTTSIILACALVVSPAFADSLSHSGKAVHHSARGTSHASVAVAQTAASIIAVPLAVGGGALQITGAALESAGAVSVKAGSEVLDQTTPRTKGNRVVRANPAPRLD